MLEVLHCILRLLGRKTLISTEEKNIYCYQPYGDVTKYIYIMTSLLKVTKMLNVILRNSLSHIHILIHL
jgi:hypothetical protein